MTATLTARIVPGPFYGRFVGIATDPDGVEIRVRFRRSNHGGMQWRCDRCGAHRFATCSHERAVLAAHRSETR